MYCRAFKGVDAASIARYLVESLALEEEGSGSMGKRPVFVSKSRGERQAKARFVSLIESERLSDLIFREEPIKIGKIEAIISSHAHDEVATKRTRRETIEELCLPWLGKISYSEQLIKKRKIVEEAMSSALEKVNKAGKSRGYTERIEWQNLRIDETIHVDSEMEKIKGYRNKCEFTFGLNSKNEPDIGFMHLRATMRSEPVVAAGEGLMHVPKGIREIVENLRYLLRSNIDCFPLFSHVEKTGVWRLVAIRECPLSYESQVVVQSGPIFEIEKKVKFESILKKFAIDQKITSLFVQYNASLTDTTVLSDLHEMVLLHGPESIEMRIPFLHKDDKSFVKFKVHPLSFFQTNTKGCSYLYNRVVSTLLSDSSSHEETIVFDVCCGVGTIGQYLASCCSNSNGINKIIGVDLVDQAIQNAQENALLNTSLSGAMCEYVAGRAESVLPTLIEAEKTNSKRIVAVVDPPRVGLHKSVIDAIRRNEEIATVVYVSCNPLSLAQDLVKFCEPLTSCPDEEGVAVNKRFQPISAVAVDMFPNTVHCEVVVHLSRA